MNNQETRGIIMFNRGDSCCVRAIVAMNSIRKFWNGPATFYLETPYPPEFDEACKFFNFDIVHNDEKHELKTLVRKTDMFGNPPYDRTLWLDADMVVIGKIDEMFDMLDEADCVIPHFCGWHSDGKIITKRTGRFKGIAEERHLEKAAKHYPAVNTGILSFRKSEKWQKFVKDWVDLADRGAKKHIFIADEVAFQILYPSADEWGLKIKIAPTDFNVSVLHDHDQSKDRRVIHFHGKKHVLDVPLCDIWKKEFSNLMETNTANIRHYAEKYPDKRLSKYLRGKRPGMGNDVTIVTACDEKYVEFLRITYPNWRKFKSIDEYQVLIFVNGIPLDDKRLDFLRLPNIKLIQWDMPEITDHREKMLNAFVFGTAEHVKTDYWLKMDCDSYATNDKPLISEDMKQYAFCGHKWRYSRPEHIRKLDEWAKSHDKRKLKNAKPMIDEGKIEGNRFYHNKRRTISYIQLHKTKFTRFCVKLLKAKKLPVPSQDTYMFFVCDRFDPHLVGVRNFKREHGFTQGNSRQGVDVLKKRVEDVDKMNAAAENYDESIEEIDSNEDEGNNIVNESFFKFLGVNSQYPVRANVKIISKN